MRTFLVLMWRSIVIKLEGWVLKNSYKSVNSVQLFAAFCKFWVERIQIYSWLWLVILNSPNQYKLHIENDSGNLIFQWKMLRKLCFIDFLSDTRFSSSISFDQIKKTSIYFCYQKSIKRKIYPLMAIIVCWEYFLFFVFFCVWLCKL